MTGHPRPPTNSSKAGEAVELLRIDSLSYKYRAVIFNLDSDLLPLGLFRHRLWRPYALPVKMFRRDAGGHVQSSQLMQLVALLNTNVDRKRIDEMPRGNFVRFDRNVSSHHLVARLD